MNKRNPLYKNQGIHSIGCIFTVDEGIIKVLLLKKNDDPYKGKWLLLGGSVYNNEDTDTALKREIKEKLNLDYTYIEQFHTFSSPERSQDMRMVAVSYIGLTDIKKINQLEISSEYEFFRIDKLPKLAYDHLEILTAGIEALKHRMIKSTIANLFMPDEFTLPELQRVYECILGKGLDRRNFRRKLLSLDIIETTSKNIKNSNGAIFYQFKNEDIEEIDIFNLHENV